MPLESFYQLCHHCYRSTARRKLAALLYDDYRPSEILDGSPLDLRCPNRQLSNKKQVGTKKVEVGNDQEMAQSERESHTKNRGGRKLN